MSNSSAFIHNHVSFIGGTNINIYSGYLLSDWNISTTFHKNLIKKQKQKIPIFLDLL